MPRYNGGFIGHDGLDAPDAPTIGTPSAGSTEADIAFTAGAAGTTATTEFVATTNDGIGATGTSSPITITGLTNGTSYTARVYAKNSHGTSAASEASASFTPLAEVISGLFQTTLWDGNGSNQTITNNINLSGKGGLVWIKPRNVALVNGLFDTERGIGSSFAYRLMSDGTDAQSELSDGLSSFNSNGFTLGNSTVVNGNTYEYVGWTFRKQPKFFDIVTYTGNFTAGKTVSHNLGSVPGMILIKDTSNTRNWIVYHRSIGEGKFLKLNSTDAEASNTYNFNNTAPTSTQFTLGESTNTNTNGATYVAYLFAHNNNDGGFGTDSEDIIKCGSYTGNETNPNSINLGFEPQWIMVKATSKSQNWFIVDVMRGITTGGDEALLSPNLSDAEGGNNYFSVTPTGFNVENSGTFINETGQNYIYMAIRRPDMSTPTVASEVFSIDSQGSSAPYFDSTHIVDMALVRPMGSGGSGGGGAFNYARLMGEKYLKTSSTAAEANASEAGFDFMNGHIDQNWGGTNTYSWMWKRAKGYFDVVAYTGTGSNRTVNHSLGVTPEMMWIKCRSNTDNWVVYHSGIGATKILQLNNDIADTTTSTRFNDTAPTSSVFTVGTDNEVNGSGRTYIAHLFATVAGVSKIGSYTGDGSAGKVIDCGFTNGAKFVLIKELSSSHNWFVYDTTRGISSGNDPYFWLNTNDAENDQTDSIDPDSSGFAVNYANTNSNGETYIFYAIATDPS